MLVVLKRLGMPGGIRQADVVAALHQDVFAILPDEGPNPLRSINSGIPLINRYPRCAASKAIRRLAQDLLTMKSARTVAIQTASEPDKARKDALLASSQFG